MRGRKRTAKAEGRRSVRASISFPSDVYKELDDIAREKRVSLAWVVRDAAEKYLAERWPLFAKKEPRQN